MGKIRGDVVLALAIIVVTMFSGDLEVGASEGKKDVHDLHRELRYKIDEILEENKCWRHREEVEAFGNERGFYLQAVGESPCHVVLKKL